MDGLGLVEGPMRIKEEGEKERMFNFLRVYLHKSVYYIINYSMCKNSAYIHILHLYLCPRQTLTAMPECSQTPRRQRPDYLADFTSGSSADNSCSSSEEEDEDRRKAGGGGRGGGRGGEKREKKVSYDLGESKEKNLAERAGKAAGYIKVSKYVFIRELER